MAKEEPKSQRGFDILFNKSVPHIIEKIFYNNLDYNSLMACRKVNKSWRGLLSSELFKKKAMDLLHEKRVNEGRLCEYSRKGNTVEVRSLLSIGTDPNCNTAGNPLIGAAVKGHRKVVEILLNAGANTEHVWKYGGTALHWASEYGQKDVVQLLLNAGAKVDLADEFGNTPLLRAARNNHKETILLLIEGGAMGKLQGTIFHFLRKLLHFMTILCYIVAACFLGGLLFIYMF